MNKRDEAVLEEFEKRYWIYLVAHYPEKEKGLFGDMKRFFLQKLQEERKAFGGCEKCYGKGYSTQLEFYSGKGEADIGDGDIRVEGQCPYYNPCDCERGKQINEMLRSVV